MHSAKTDHPDSGTTGNLHQNRIPDHRAVSSVKPQPKLGNPYRNLWVCLCYPHPVFPSPRRNPFYFRNYTKFPVSHRKGRSGGDVEKACGFLFSQTYEQVFNTLLRTDVENCEMHLSTRRICRKTLYISSVSPPTQQPLHSISTPQNPISTTC